MLRGVAYMFKRIGPKTESWGMPQERDRGDVTPETRTERERESERARAR